MSEPLQTLIAKLEIGLARSVTADNPNYGAVMLTIAEVSILLAAIRASAPTPIGDRICPWCGDELNLLKPSGGCLIADIHGYAAHPECADAYEEMRDRPAEQDLIPWVQHKDGCEAFVQWLGYFHSATTPSRCTCGLDTVLRPSRGGDET